MKKSIRVAVNNVTFIPSSVKIGPLVQMSKEDIE
jgi:hypothetical protein